MASTSASSVQKSFRYDVFLSFRGEDTRKTFVDHLYAALEKKGIITYKDDENIEKGERISEQLLRSIEESRFYIIVFSKNYASSSWCLDELVKIMECQRMAEHPVTVYPVFYDVEPTEVRSQSGAVGEAFAKHVSWSYGLVLRLYRIYIYCKTMLLQRSFFVDRLTTNLKLEDDVKRWRNALNEAAELAGTELKNTFDGHEAKIIQNLVIDISLKLHFTNPRINKKLVGMEARVRKVIESLETDSTEDDVRMIGIKGIGGGGKTTLARAVFDHISFLFDGQSFVENVKGSDLKNLQKQVLQDVLNDEKFVVTGVYDGINKMRKIMSNTKVLVVLDDVDGIEQLDALAGETTWFKAGSRIIITTRDEQVLVAHGVHSDNIHDIHLLSNEEAIRLFSRCAFQREVPVQEFEELSRKVVSYAHGLPLTITVLGKQLFGKDVHEWEDALKRLETIPEGETLKRLELSYDALQKDHKEIFLDVACMLKGVQKHDAIRILESLGLHAQYGLRVLEQKSLITVSNSGWIGWIGMHDRIEEMGRDIVRRLHPEEPNKHTRLWIKDEIEDILVKELCTEATLSIKLKYTTLHPAIIMKGLKKMKKIKFLYVGDACGRWNIDDVSPYLPNTLQFLSWHEYPFWCLPETFEASKLVGLEMFKSNISQIWKEGNIKVLDKLRFLNLSYSKLKTFNIGLTPLLERLHLNNCELLIELDMPHECLKLKYLNLSGSKVSSLNLGLTPQIEKLVLKGRNFVELNMPHECSKLKFLNLNGSKVSSLNLGLTPNLEELYLSDCKDIVELKMLHDCPNLRFLNLNGSKVSSLNLGLTSYIQTLNLSGCGDFVELNMPRECPKLQVLNLRGSKVGSLNLGLTPKIENLDLEGCNDFLELNMLYECPKLKFLNLNGSKVSSLNLGLTPNIEELYLEECNEFLELNMPQACQKLKVLSLRHSKLIKLKLGLTPHLETLDLEGCNEFVELNVLHECPKLKVLNLNDSKVNSLNLGLTPHIERLDLRGCCHLQDIHAPMGCLKNLVYFNLKGCLRFEVFSPGVYALDKLQLIAKSLDVCPSHPNSTLPKFQFKCIYDEPLDSQNANIERLISFGLCACTNLESFSAAICGLQHLRKFRLEGNIPEAPKDLGQLESLEELTLLMQDIKHLPDNICMLKHLKFLDLKSCWLLEQLPKDLDKLECLEKLDLTDCIFLRDIPNSICMLKHLKMLKLKSCWLLEHLPKHIGRLECLEELDLTDCRFLRDIPNNICNMKGLKYLGLRFCILVDKLPEEVGRLECLKELNIEGVGVNHLPQSIFQLKGLRIIGSRWRLESYGFTSLEEMATDTSFLCYIA